MPSLGARLARGEESAFADLYDICADRLHHYLSVRLGSRDRASDVLQSTFVRAVNYRRRFSRASNPVAYVFQIARNESARFLARRLREVVPFQNTSERASTDGHQQRFDDKEIASAALAKLSADDRELIELKIYSGLTFDEIASVTGLPAATVSTRYRRALVSLRPWLEKQFR